ncbi:MAG TPA: hypothetical protein VKY26_10670, partial [Actinomycetota bacterium]|nr:hypothetical protein [Actinomycetota bacterium]
GAVPAQDTLWSGLGLASDVVYETPSGVFLWDSATQRITRQFGGSSARVLGASASLVAWCDGDCGSLHLSTASGHDVTVPIPALEGHFESTASFSPDGSRVAIIAGGGTEGPGAVTVINTSSGATEWVASQQIPGGASLAWSPDGSRLFAAWYEAGEKRTSVVEYEAGGGAASVTSVPVIPVDVAMVAVRATDAAGLIPRRLGPAQRCQQPPPIGAGPCGFSFPAVSPSG